MQTEYESGSIKSKIKEMKINLRITLTVITTATYINFGYNFQPMSLLGLQFKIWELIVGMGIHFP